MLVSLQQHITTVIKQNSDNKCNGIGVRTGPLACLSLSSVDVVDKDQDSRSGIGSLLLLFSGSK